MKDDARAGGGHGPSVTDTHKLRAFALYLAGDGYTDEHVRMIEEAADEIERLRTEMRELHDQLDIADQTLLAFRSATKAEEE